jgi:hypothetical protein
MMNDSSDSLYTRLGGFDAITAVAETYCHDWLAIHNSGAFGRTVAMMVFSVKNNY